MKNSKIGFLVASLALTGVVGCGDDDGGSPVDAAVPKPDVATIDATPPIDADPAAPDAAPMDINVDTDITGDTTWTFPNTYFLKKHVFVKGGTLTIEAGVIVKGDSGTSLVITREAKINAVGTADKPILFTSVKPVGERAPGNWGGIVLLGKAKLNLGTATEQGIEGFPAGTAEVLYGGNDNEHNCGTIKYARVEFPGFTLENNKELNGISVGACGSQTTLDFIQVHKSSDDGIEFFGGTAGVKHLIVDQGLDDGLDWDFGWTGKVQFIVVQTGQGDGECGFEADNHPDVFDASPRAMPTIYNATLVGPANPTGKVKIGMLFRKGTGAKVFNTILTGYNGLPIDVRDPQTVAQTPANLFVNRSFIFGNALQADDKWVDATDNDGGFKEGEYFKLGARNNKELDPKLTAAFDFVAPNFKPAADSAVLIAANAEVPNAAEGFDATATFVGAIGTDDWTAGWTAFPQN